jgi:hypothetical protein
MRGAAAFSRGRSSKERDDDRDSRLGLFFHQPMAGAGNNGALHIFGGGARSEAISASGVLTVSMCVFNNTCRINKL